MPAVPVHLRTAVPPFTVRRRFEAKSVTAWAGSAQRAHNSVRSSVELYLLLRLTRQDSLGPFEFRLSATDSSFECEAAVNDLEIVVPATTPVIASLIARLFPTVNDLGCLMSERPMSVIVPTDNGSPPIGNQQVAWVKPGVWTR